ncbi:MAG: DUF2723 domain-containing protein [bacterium]|nr:DUF2723 domain-containing protein [bacterium]
MKKLIFLSIFLPIYVLYLLTMSPTVFWQDSGIFLSGIKVFGVLFPPGFPLYLLLGVLWTKTLSFLPLLPTLSFAHQVYAFSALWGAAASALIGLSVYTLISRFKPPTSPTSSTFPTFFIVIPILSGLLAGLSYSLWAQSTNAEVYSMVGFFAASIFYLVIKISLSYPKIPPKYLLLLSGIWGLSFGVHLLTITFALPLLWLSIALRFSPPIRIKVIASLIFLLAAILPYLYLPLRSTPDNQMLWSKIDSPTAFINHVIGQDYMSSENAIKAADFSKIQSYAVLFFQEFFVVGILLGFLGLVFLLKQKKQFQAFALFGLVFGVILYLLITFYERGTEYNYWLIPFYLFWSILVGVGLYKLVESVKSSLLRLPVLLILSVLLVLPILYANLPILNRSQYFLAEEFGKNLIGKLPQNAIFFTIGDQESSIPLYLNLVLGYRRDLAVIAPSDLLFGWKSQLLAKRRPDLILPKPESDDPINTFIRDNLDKQIFVITKNYLPLSSEFKLIPAGTIWQVKRQEDTDEINLAFWDYTFSDPNRYLRPERPEMATKNTEKRFPYFHEAQVFELQAKKNLGDWCFEAYQAEKTIPVLTQVGKHEVWQGKKLAECALEAYEAMFKIDPDFEHGEIFKRIGELEGK